MERNAGVMARFKSWNCHIVLCAGKLLKCPLHDGMVRLFGYTIYIPKSHLIAFFRGAQDLRDRIYPKFEEKKKTKQNTPARTMLF